jgi:valyl-tRNA synthetase
MAKSKGYDFREIEEKIMKLWEKLGIYQFDPNSKAEIFSIDSPPPTISGRLHMGHAFGDSQQDFFVRYKRMRGFNVLNPFGTDNNGLPTLRLVEKERKIKANQMSREKFIEICNKTIEEEFIPSFVKDAKRLGISADWNLFYSTIDKRSRRISQKSFIDLYKQGREYRVESPALWCTECQTTIAQVELEDREINSKFNDIVFKVGEKDLIVSTTRPELLSACVAIFINPQDKRCKNFVGKKAKVPLFDFEVPILEDEAVDMEKGTGVVMCCTFGDQKDMEWQKQHTLPIKEAISSEGKMTSSAGKYEGLSIKDARNKIIEDLKEKRLLLKQKDISHAVNVHERCGNEVEFISSKQWFIKYLDLKKDLLKWGKQIKWYPSSMRNRYDNWVNGLKWDWCISRQIAFGIPFPVWYCKKCDEVILADEKQLPVDPLEDQPPLKECPNCKCKEFVPEKDIMNTWATSALTPTIVKDLLRETKVYDKIEKEPMSVRRNGQDIITFWDFNTIVKSQLHYGINPWKELYINGWILARDGSKMSKSRGNGISPQEVISEWGADVLRYLSAAISPGTATAFSDKELVAGKKFVNKLFNASKFVFMNLEGYSGEKPEIIEEIDQLFLIKTSRVIERVSGYFEEYELSKAKLEIEEFFWKDFADNYIEAVKKRVYNEKGNKKLSAQYTLYQTLLAVLKMIAPIMPFVTEEIYQEYFKETEKDESIHVSGWPVSFEKGDERLWNDFCEMVSRIRKEKSEKNKSMNAEIKLSLNKEDFKKFFGILDAMRDIMNISEIEEGKFKVDFK